MTLGSSEHHRRSAGRERRLLLYLCAIAVPSVALLYLSWQSIETQRHAMASLTLSNARLAAERMAAEVETRLLALVDVCLKDPRVAEFVRLARSDDGLTARDQVRRLASTLVAEHPVASHMFVVDVAGPRYPALHAPLPRSLKSHPSAGGALAAFVREFQEAEQLELREEQLARALEQYRRCTSFPVPSEFKALALARIARVSTRMGRPQEARATWMSLATGHADDRDLVNQPFGVIAALELMQLEPAGQELQRLVLGSYEQFVNGRWTLSADEADYFRERYLEALGHEKLERTTRFLEEHRLARVLSRQMLQPDSGGVEAAVSGDGPNTVLLYASAEDSGVVGLAVNFAWIIQHVLPAAAGDGPLWGRASIVSGESPVGRAATRVPFPRLLKPFDLILEPSDKGAAAAPRRQVWIFAGSTALTLALLGLALSLVIRDVARESELSHLRSELVSGVSHELKTPLTLIRVFAETLSGDPVPPDPERRHFSSVIVREVDRLTALIDRLLNSSRIDRGARPYQLNEGPLDHAVHGALERYGDYLRAHGFTVSVSIEPEVPTVRHDRDAVIEAVGNLLDNAAKYSGDSREIGLVLSRRDEQVLLEVNDKGIGIAAGDHERIFERFYRASTQTGRGGYGLGLFLVRHMMEAHAGTIELESEPGHGSRFRLVFPVADSGARNSKRWPRS